VVISMRHTSGLHFAFRSPLIHTNARDIMPNRFSCRPRNPVKPTGRASPAKSGTGWSANGAAGRAKPGWLRSVPRSGRILAGLRCSPAGKTRPPSSAARFRSQRGKHAVRTSSASYKERRHRLNVVVSGRNNIGSVDSTYALHGGPTYPAHHDAPRKASSGTRARSHTQRVFFAWRHKIRCE